MFTLRRLRPSGGPALLAALLTAACAQPATPDDTADSDAPMDSALPDFSVVPVWSADELSAEVEPALALGLPSPFTLRDVYLDLMSKGDEGCPGDETQLVDSKVPAEGCTADSGVTYQGVSNWWTAGEQSWDAEGMWSFILTAGFQIHDEEGDNFLGGGNTAFTGWHEGSNPRYNALTKGTFRYEDEDGWLGEGVSCSFSMSGGVSSGLAWLEIDGGVGFGDTNLYFNQVSIGDPACDGQATGELRVRDPSGAWYSVDFGERCDGCGALSFAGESLSQDLCLDLRPLAEAMRAAMGAE